MLLLALPRLPLFCVLVPCLFLSFVSASAAVLCSGAVLVPVTCSCRLFLSLVPSTSALVLCSRAVLVPVACSSRLFLSLVACRFRVCCCAVFSCCACSCCLFLPLVLVACCFSVCCYAVFWCCACSCPLFLPLVLVVSCCFLSCLLLSGWNGKSPHCSHDGSSPLSSMPADRTAAARRCCWLTCWLGLVSGAGFLGLGTGVSRIDMGALFLGTGFGVGVGMNPVHLEVVPHWDSIQGLGRRSRGGGKSGWWARKACGIE